MTLPLEEESYGTHHIPMNASEAVLESKEMEMLSLTTKQRAKAFGFGTPGGAVGGGGSSVEFHYLVHELVDTDL